MSTLAAPAQRRLEQLDRWVAAGWQVLTALTSDVLTSREGHLQWVSFTVRSSIAA